MDMTVIEQARQGDKEAFRKIYAQTSGFVYNTARRITSCDEDAQEVTQDVFVAAHGALSGFRGEAALRTWLYRITVNRSLNKIRARRRQKQEVPYEEYMDTEQTTLPDKGLIEKDADNRAQMLLNQVSADFRACLVLREIERLSYEDIAKALGIKVNTVRTRISRARQQLAAIIKEGGVYAL